MTNPATPLGVSPFFLAGAIGNIFGLYFMPQGTVRGALLYVPPFGEEMNRCRDLVANQARMCAQMGYAVLVVDLYGTGDSGGELADADWTIWRTDVAAAANWLGAQAGVPVTLWGLRLGALLAANLANDEPAKYHNLLLWQPVLDGKTFLTQILRLRVAFLMDRNLPPETTEQMRTTLQAGGSVEISGYRVASKLAMDLDKIRMADFTALSKHSIAWFENVSGPDKPLPVGSQKALDLLRTRGCEISTSVFSDPPIWSLHKRDHAPELLAKTTEFLKARP